MRDDVCLYNDDIYTLHIVSLTWLHYTEKLPSQIMQRNIMIMINLLVINYFSKMLSDAAAYNPITVLYRVVWLNWWFAVWLVLINGDQTGFVLCKIIYTCHGCVIAIAAIQVIWYVCLFSGYNLDNEVPQQPPYEHEFGL